MRGVLRVESSFQPVRVVLVEAGLSGRRSEAAETLEQLGPGTRVDRVTDAASCRARVSTVPVDLVVLENTPAARDPSFLRQLSALGPPVIVVLHEAVAGDSLDALRAGATECVEPGPDLDSRLTALALDQVRQGRRYREHEEAERRIVELEDYTENIVQHMNSALIVVDDSGRITEANPPAEEVLGAEPGTLAGRSFEDWFVPEEDEATLISRTLEEGHRFKGAETTIRRSDGRRVPVGISCAPMKDRRGRNTQAVVLFQDLTEVKQLELQMLQSEKMASIGQLAAGVAHEINNPTGFIHANLHQMNEYLADLRRTWKVTAELQAQVARGDLGEAQRVSTQLSQLAEELDVDFVYGDFAKAVRESQEGSERIRHIVQDLRDFSYRDTGERVEADVNQCLDSTANIVWPMMKHSVALAREYDELPRLRCYPMQLKQVFMNLLVNAYQAIEGRREAESLTEPGEIRISTEAQADGIGVEIRDTGSGIASEDLGRIFDPFFTTKEVGVGTGLGLSTSYSIIERHGGRIRVESEVGVGTSFQLWLPTRVPTPEPADD